MRRLTKPETDALRECASWKDGMHPGWKVKTMPKLEERGLVARGPGRSCSGRGDNWWHVTEAGRSALAQHETEKAKRSTAAG